MKLTHERKELVTVDGGFDIEIEAVFELALGDLTALKFDKVDTGSIEARHYAEEGTGEACTATREGASVFIPFCQ